MICCSDYAEDWWAGRQYGWCSRCGRKWIYVSGLGWYESVPGREELLLREGGLIKAGHNGVWNIRGLRKIIQQIQRKARPW